MLVSTGGPLSTSRERWLEVPWRQRTACGPGPVLRKRPAAVTLVDITMSKMHLCRSTASTLLCCKRLIERAGPVERPRTYDSCGASYDVEQVEQMRTPTLKKKKMAYCPSSDGTVDEPRDSSGVPEPEALHKTSHSGAHALNAAA